MAPMIPRGAVTKTKARREKLWSWIISSANITTAMAGNTAARATFALALSSIEPPVSTCSAETGNARRPSGKQWSVN